MDVDQQLAQGQLLDSDLDHTVGVLRHSKLVQCLVPLDKLTADPVVHLCVLLFSIHWLHLLLVLHLSIIVLTIVFFAIVVASGLAKSITVHILTWLLHLHLHLVRIILVDNVIA